MVLFFNPHVLQMDHVNFLKLVQNWKPEQPNKKQKNQVPLDPLEIQGTEPMPIV